MKNKLFSLILAGAMLSGAAQVKAVNENYAFGWVAGLGANIMCSAIMLKAADGILPSIDKTNVTNVTLLGATNVVAQAILSTGSFWAYKKISKDEKPSEFTKLAFWFASVLSSAVINSTAAAAGETLSGIAMAGMFGNALGGAINCRS